MDESQRWTCHYCGHSEAVVEDDNDASLRAWASHINDVHGEAALEETLGAAMDEFIETLKAEGKVLHDPFNGNDYFVEDPPERDE
jgi:hypothetical protein